MEVTKTISPHFKEYLFDWEHKFYLLVGGYGSGKSYHTALKIILKLLNERRTCLVVRNVYATIRDSCFLLMREICNDLNLEDELTFQLSPMSVTFKNGSRIIFRGMDNPAKLKSIHDISLIWIEEASEISYNAFKELLGRLRHPSLKLHVILSLNPAAKNNWTYKHFFELRDIDDTTLYRRRTLQTDNTFYHHSTVDDNRFSADEYRLQLDDMKNYDTDLYRVARLGQFGTSGVRVLQQFEIQSSADVMKAVESIPRRLKFVGLDFGFVTSYNACVRCAVDDVDKRLYVYWEWYERGLTDDVIVERLKEFKDTRELIHCDSAEPKTIAYLRKNGINATGCKKFAGSRLYNIRKLKRFKRIICADNCTNCIAELSTLTFKLDKDDNVTDEFVIDAHTFDAIAYALDNYDVTDLKYITKADFGL